MATASMKENSCLSTLRQLRETLVDRIENQVDVLVERLTSMEVFSRDDREEVLCENGSRRRVRKVLDILDCKGEEASRTFLLAIRHLGEMRTEGTIKTGNSTDYTKLIKKHKAVLKRRSESMLYYNARHGEKMPFSQHYVNLLVVKGHHSLEIKKHEVLTFGQHRLSMQCKSVEQRIIKPSQLFTAATGSQSAKKILVSGIAGIGKTVLVQKILYDFGRDEEHCNFDFIMHLTFRDLNLISKPISFRELLLRKNSHLTKCIDAILANESKLLIILDGFDEFKYYHECDVDVFVTDPDEKGEIAEVLSSLIQGELLPEASVLLTSRPMAVSHVPIGAIDCFTLITGFSTMEIRDFFKKFFQWEKVAQEMFETVQANEFMLTLCYIPAFCHIVCSTLKESHSLPTNTPRTMTDIYTQYLVALLRTHTQARVDTSLNKNREKEECHEIVIKLGKLAYEKLLNHETLFYGSSVEVMELACNSVVSTFLDKTSMQEPGFTEDVYSFTHLTVQEFFAALYCAMEDGVLPEILLSDYIWKNSSGHWDLFLRFLSGLLSNRNQELLSRSARFVEQVDSGKSFCQWLLKDTEVLCETGAYILTHLHCLFEQQDDLLLQELHPKEMHINLTDATLSTVDHLVVRNFLQGMQRTIKELDLTGTGVSSEELKNLQPCLSRCERLWLGENSLDVKAIHVIADVLKSSDTLEYLGLGWTNISDEEVFVLADAIKIKQTLRELCAIWNDVSKEEAEPLNCVSAGQCFTVSFTDDLMWEQWVQWVLQRCNVSNTDKLVTVLYKICKVSVCDLEIPWARGFYTRLLKLIRERKDKCDEDDLRRKLEKFESIVATIVVL
ncbi:NACHT, LRR and PYD domains-containing protein 3-like isoform X2 [Denticeps clupeoides]|uniref:NACHT, LRR and PYD domains-containing protein 3-like isoform X2 n=1 Tax=Denticeps clupeoides TaxID=299321 RepID=UPI0010A40124|nr:NACHT, LRR and PYD domains-containing protein 3-like isoform X2 [Denticeps clupeoides]